MQQYSESELFLRQNKFYSPEKMNQQVTIIGCGSLGGFIALALCKMGLQNFILYDHDSVEPHNISNQPFSFSQIGLKKSSALNNIITSSSPKETNVLERGKWQGNAISRGIVINSPDSITVRREVFNETPPGSFIIDVRSGPESYDVFFCDTAHPKMTAFYAGTFFDPPNSVSDGCGAQSVIWCGMQIAALAANGWMRHCNKKPVPVHISGSLESLHMEQLYPNGQVNWVPEETD